MAIPTCEFERLVHEELISDDPDVKRLAIKRLYNIMTGVAALDDASAAATVKSMAQAIDAAL